MKKTNEKKLANLFKTKKFVKENYEADKKNLITKYYESVSYTHLNVKYFTWCLTVLTVLLGIIAFSSCLDTNDTEIEFISSDAQIYGITLSAAYDSTGTLANAEFSIDQRASLIYNRDSLDYGFEPKNAYLTCLLYTSRCV